MRRKTLGITTALVSAAASADAGTVEAGAAPLPVTPLPAKQEAPHAAAEQAGTISSALGLSGGEQLAPRDVMRDADGTHHIRFDRTLDGLKVIGDLVVARKSGKITGVTKASEATLSGLDTSAAASADAKLVVFALNQTPVLAWETVTHAAKEDQTPSELHTCTDATLLSGIANHFFYLLPEGSGQKTVNGVAYDSPTIDNQPATGIGRAKADKVRYRALTTKLTSGTKYAAARTGTLTEAADLHSAGSAEYAAVDRAWAAVNVE